MVRFCLFFLMLFIVLPLLSQSNCDAPRVAFSHPEKELPIFDKSSKNDFKKLYEFLMENLIYPETAKADKIEGQVFVQFWIDTCGFTSEHKVIISIRQDLDDEALRVMKLVKFDIPAKTMNGNKPVGTCWQLPITFRLEDPEFLYYKQSEKVKPKSKNGKGASKGGVSVSPTFTLLCCLRNFCFIINNF